MAQNSLRMNKFFRSGSIAIIEREDFDVPLFDRGFMRDLF